MIPHGDRRDGAESRGIEDEKVTTIEAQNDVVRVFILRHDLADRSLRSLLARPLQHVGEGEPRGESIGCSPNELRRDCPNRGNRYGAHACRTVASMSWCQCGS